ncbi:MAG: alpha-2-macroglobulin family protein, partial [Chloroflexota bacterium]|nr:alpha-2-macroglobulin family protein [Chloroflexota bacterium]
TDENGHAQVSVELPDTLTTWRLSAKAITADTEVGEADVDIVSTKDLLVRPTAPRFFVVGDAAELAAVVHNNTDQPIEAEVALSAEGLIVAGGSKQAAVPAHGKKKVSWEVAVDNVEEAKLLFSAKGGGLSDVVELTLPVYHYSTPEVVATSGQLTEAGERLEAVYLPEELSPGRGELTIQLEHSLAAGTRDGLDYLEHYPYACIEQTVSRFLPNVITYRALRKLGIEREEMAAKLPQQVSVALQRIYAEQHYDGGWGWWLADDSDPYLTAYVLLGLNEARRAGFAVNKEVIERAVEFLKGSFVKLRDVEHPYQANTQAFVLYVLAECGEGDLGRTVALYERRDILESYGKAYLGMALALLAPEERTRLDSIVSDLVSSAQLSATGAHWEEEERDYWTMNTDTRSTAIVLEALTRLAPKSEILPQAVRWLTSARREGHWETTQETAWTLIALTDYLVATEELEADYSYRVSLNGEELAEGTATSENLDEQRKLVVEIDELLRGEANRLLIECQEPTGKGRLYYSAHLRYFLPAEEVRAESRGIVVARQYSPVDEPDRFITGASVGDTIRVKLTIVAPNDLHYLVVEDPLPAGCEAIDMSLKTASVVGERPELVRLGEEEGWGWWCFSHTELRDEKAVLFATHLPKGTYEYTYLMRASIPGRFSVKPARAYLMYFPEVWGRSDGAEFRVARSTDK